MTARQTQLLVPIIGQNFLSWYKGQKVGKSACFGYGLTNVYILCQFSDIRKSNIIAMYPHLKFYRHLIKPNKLVLSSKSNLDAIYGIQANLPQQKEWRQEDTLRTEITYD